MIAHIHMLGSWAGAHIFHHKNSSNIVNSNDYWQFNFNSNGKHDLHDEFDLLCSFWQNHKFSFTWQQHDTLLGLALPADGHSHQENTEPCHTNSGFGISSIIAVWEHCHDPWWVQSSTHNLQYPTQTWSPFWVPWRLPDLLHPEP